MTGITDLLGPLIDNRMGVIRSLREIRRSAGAPDFVCMSAETCKIDGQSALLEEGRLYGTGVSTDRERAVAKAVGEAVERYCAVAYLPEAHPLARSASAPFRCVEPDTFALYSAEQYAEPAFPFSPFTRETQIRWAEAVDLISGEKCSVPTNFVYLSYGKEDNLREPRLAPLMSTGLACHTDRALATISGICEVIERDAIAIVWQAKLSRPQVRLDSLSDPNRCLLHRLQRPGATIVLLDFTLDHGIPVVFATMRSEVRTAPALVVAAGCSLDPEQAVQKSLEELAQIISFAQRERQSKLFTPGANWEHVNDPKSHAAVYYARDNLRAAEFLFSSPKRIDFQILANHSTGDSESDLGRLLDCIASTRHTVLLADVTTEDIHSLGLHVVRAIIPGFQPLFMGHRFRALGGIRLWTLQQKYGTADRGLKRDNPYPHPFA